MSLDNTTDATPAGDETAILRVLMVADDAEHVRSCTDVLRLAEPGCAVTIVPDLYKAMTTLRADDRWDLVLTDLDLPDSHGALETVRSVVTAAHPAPVVVVASGTSSGFHEEAVAVGAQDVIAKEECDARTLTRVVRHSIERSRLISEVRSMCLMDPLTGLPNRRLWRDRCKVIWSGAARRGESVAVLFCDVDGIKRINELHGHSSGDTVLQTVGRTLGNVTRANDTAARVSGDEFCVAAAVADRQEAERLALRVANALGSVGYAMPKDLRFTVSVGVSVVAPDRSTYERATDKAEAAMKRAKAEGKGRVRWFDDPVEH